jgi:ribosome-associated toxin RatA of RatAB toxin-antitoxin module
MSRPMHPSSHGGPSRRDLLLGAAASLLFPDVAFAKDRSVAERYRIPTAGSEVDTGGAILGVHAPIDQVLKVVKSYGRYHQILPRVSASRVVGKTGQSTDVYLRCPILGGVAHVWGVARFTPKKWGKKGKKVVGRYVKGNLDGFHGLWKLYPCSDVRTILRLEIFLIPKIPLPASVITPELEWAADKGVTAVRDIVECGESTVKND